MHIYIDGEFFPEADAKVSVFDHGLLYGDGIFEGIRFYNGRVFKLTEHLERLYDSARAINLAVPLNFVELTEAVLETVRRNEIREGYLRLLVTRGKGNLGLSPDRCPKASLIIIAATIQLYPPEVYQRGMTVVTCGTRRLSPGALSPAIKSLNYLNNILAKIEANLAKADEGLMLNEQGYVAECTGDNVFIVKRGEVYTPPVYSGALCGITWQAVLDIAAELALRVHVQELTRYDIYTADEFFLSVTAAEVIAAVQLDGRPIGDGQPGPITRQIIARFRELTQSSGTPIYEG
jgi:branched-chain amino acid aminotransferase